MGRPRSQLQTKRPAAPGESIKLTIDSRLQRTAEDAILYGINKARLNQQWEADAGAIVAIDPRDGAIRALASYPT